MNHAAGSRKTYQSTGKHDVPRAGPALRYA
jgi:hypothetical protein